MQRSITPQVGVGMRVRAARAGFTLLDVLVVVAVITILLALLSPALSRVRESARRVVCGSNLHQVGLGLSMWASDHDGSLPPVQFADRNLAKSPSRLLQLAHLGEDQGRKWDGLGLLVSNDYLAAANVYYCPSHHGEHPVDRYEGEWDSPAEQIVVNYHYRWLSPADRFLDNLHDDVTLVADGIRTQPDYNHIVGTNMLKADMRVEWFSDPEAKFASLLPESLQDPRSNDVQAGALMAGLDIGEVPKIGKDGGISRKDPFLNGGFGFD